LSQHIFLWHTNNNHNQPSAHRIKEQIARVDLRDDAARGPDVRGEGPTELEGHLGAAVLSGVHDPRLARVAVVRRAAEVDH